MRENPVQLLLCATLLCGAFGDSDSYKVKWMWGDAGEFTVGHNNARLLPYRWSSWQSVTKTILDIQAEERRASAMGGGGDNRKRKVDIQIKKKSTSEVVVDTQVKNLFQTVYYLRKWKDDESAAKEIERIEKESKLERWKVRWMWGDASVIGHKIANRDPLGVRWSAWETSREVIDDLQDEAARDRPVDVEVIRDFGERHYYKSDPTIHKYKNVAEAIEGIETKFKNQEVDVKSEL